MAQTGTLRTWNDDRGFGFIAPSGGGAELFVHISAFPRDGSRPTVGETLTFELGRGRDGKPAAVRVVRQALGKPSTYPTRRAVGARPRRPLIASIVSAVLVVALVGVLARSAYTHFQGSAQRRQLATLPPTTTVAPAEAPAVGSFRCDGRTHCSQMSSCAEATYFIKHCPGTKMDGNGDGVPCEQQWCTGPLAR